MDLQSDLLKIFHFPQDESGRDGAWEGKDVEG
jgi:hypothetical protein